MPSTPHVYGGVFRDATVLVTGGAGFIGSHLVHRLRQLEARVRVIDDLSTGRRENLPDETDLVEASILDEPALARAMQACRFVFHEAAMVSVPQSVETPARCAEINVSGTERVLEAARDAGARRVVFASSCAVYGLGAGMSPLTIQSWQSWPCVSHCPSRSRPPSPQGIPVCSRWSSSWLRILRLSRRVRLRFCATRLLK